MDKTKSRWGKDDNNIDDPAAMEVGDQPDIDWPGKEEEDDELTNLVNKARENPFSLTEEEEHTTCREWI